MLTHIFGNCFLHRCRNKEILLFQTKLLTSIVVVVGIKNLNNVSCQILLLNSLLIITLIKGIQLEALHCFSIPDTKGIYNAITIANDWKIIRDRLYALIAFLYKIASSILIYMDIYITAKLDDLGIFRSSQFKRIAINKPVIRNLYLIAITDLLFEHTITISDTTAICCITKCCK